MPVWGDLGLFLTPPPGRNPAGAWQDCNNVRVYQHRASSFNMGWTKYLAQQLNGPVMLITEFAPSNGTKKLVFATLKDLYQNTPGSATVTYITPRYNTGTAARSGAAVTGTGTTWSTNAKAGDFMHFGSSTQDGIGATWYEIASVNSNTSITLVGSPAGSDADGPYTLRQVFTGQQRDLWFSETFPRAGHVTPNPADRFYITNGLDDIVEWDGTSTAVTRVTATLGFKCRYLKRYKNQMIYGWITASGENRPYEIRNSLPGFPLDMTSVGAGVFTVSPGSDQIMQLETLGDELSIYTNGAIVQAQFVEAPVYFIFRTATQEAGLLASRLLANFGDHHVFVGPDAEYAFDGVSAKRVNTHVWTETLRTVDPARREQCFAAFDEQFGDLYWALCKTTDIGFGSEGPPAKALTEHYLEALSDEPVHEESDFHPFGMRDFPFHCVGYTEQSSSLTWDQMVGNWSVQTIRWDDKSLSANFPLVLAGTSGGYIMKLNTNETQDGTGFASFVQFVRRPTMETSNRNPRGKGLVKRIYPLAKKLSGYSLTVTTTVYNQIDGAGSSTVQTWPMDESGNRFVVPYRRGVWFDVQFGTAGSTTGQPWELQGYDVDVVEAGER